MRAKRSDFMVDIKTAYKIANDFFLANDYVGVYEIRETNEEWLFLGKCKQACYGTTEICVPKNGEDPYLFSITGTAELHKWINAEIVSVKS